MCLIDKKMTRCKKKNIYIRPALVFVKFTYIFPQNKTHVSTVASIMLLSRMQYANIIMFCIRSTYMDLTLKSPYGASHVFGIQHMEGASEATGSFQWQEVKRDSSGCLTSAVEWLSDSSQDTPSMTRHEINANK